ncbi:ABC transporter substrate-binding protein [Actinophytocola sediminis]
MARAGRFTATLVLLAAGCAPVADRYDVEGPIIFIDIPDTSDDRYVEQQVDAWNRTHGNDERVTFIEMPYGTDDHRAQLRTRAQDLANADPDAYPSQCYDVVSMDIIWTAEFAESGYLVPLDAEEFDADRFLRKPVEAVTVDGRLWAIPLRTDPGLLYYRTDLVEPPATWTELAEQASDPPPGMYGYVGQFDRYEGLAVNAFEAIWGAGGDVLAPDGTVLVGSEQARAGVRLLAEGVQDGWIPHEALGFKEEQSREAFQEGSALFLRNWPYAYRLLADENSPVAGRFDVATLPGPSALGGWNLGISSCSAHRRTARDFIKFLTSEDNQRLAFQQASAGPTIAALYQDPELLADRPYLKVLGESLRDARARPPVPYYEDVSDAIQEHVGDALEKPTAADDRVEDLAERLARITRPG